MKEYVSLYDRICSFENLYQVFRKTSRFKKSRREVLEFEYNLENELFRLRDELRDFTYQPEPLKNLHMYKPKKREISILSFRDRIVQQAVLEVISPLFEKSFIYDSYAFIKDKGAHLALIRFDKFKRKVSPRRFPNAGFILKGDIKDYYLSIKHDILISIISNKDKVKDRNVICLIKKFLHNYSPDKGIAQGNPLSQLFANIYLNEFDYFVKHSLREKYYIRYCDDFIVFKRNSKGILAVKKEVEEFLRKKLKLELNKNKTKVVKANQGVDFLGFKIFYFYRFVLKKNSQIFKKRLARLQNEYASGSLDAKKLSTIIQGWISYASFGNSYNLRKRLLSNFIFTKAQ
jgi:retron-type reverse transcriptase